MNPTCLLDIVEIRLLVAKYLVRTDWTVCALVCKDWNSTFSPFLYAKVYVALCRVLVHDPLFNPPIDSVIRNKDFVKSFEFDGGLSLGYSAMVSAMVFPSLTILSMSFPSSRRNPDVADMILRNPTLTHLSLERVAVPDSIANSSVRLWRAVAELPHLESLRVSRQRIGSSIDEVYAFWDACARPKTLSLSLISYEYHRCPTARRVRGSYMLTAISSRAFSQTQELSILQCRFSLFLQTLLIKKCQRLKTLKWMPLSEVYGTRTPLKLVFSSVLSERQQEQRLASSTSSELLPTDLDLSQTMDLEEAYASVIRACSGMPVEELVVADLEFGTSSIGALEEHLPTLRHVDLGGCSGVTSPLVLHFLKSCPRLENFAAHQLCSVDILCDGDDEVWACERTLRRLRVHIDVGDVGGDTGPNELILKRLGRLQALELLDVVKQPHQLLKFQLSEGLWRLGGLKRLRVLSIRDCALSLEDVEWMVKHWPLLQCMDGPPVLDEQAEGYLRRRGIGVVADEVNT
ncbi:hypothetical protein BGZ58_010015 [Dissophora ornata]|nr:hypothetical protein BGZ58_010015 [Dissophora ornata]